MKLITAALSLPLNKGCDYCLKVFNDLNAGRGLNVCKLVYTIKKIKFVKQETVVGKI